MGVLDGILVVALEQAVAAPVCTLRLADAGARVIKVERPGGETARHYDSAVAGTSAYFAWLNAGKESAVLNLKEAGDLALLRRMLGQADVLVQNLAPGAMDRMGLGADTLARDFPRLIAVSIVGYGQDTDYADMKAYDLLVQAEAGLCAVTGSPDAPAKVGVSVADIATGGAAHAAVLEALIARGRTGQGASIEIAMFDAVADWMAVPLLHLEQGGRETARHGMSHASIYPYGRFDCAGGAVVLAVQTAEEWARFCGEVIGQAELAEDPRFATNALRVEHREALDGILVRVFAAASADEIAARCVRAGIAWGLARDVAGLSGHPALRRRAVALGNGRSVTLPAAPGAVGCAWADVPALGAQTEAIRAEFASAQDDPA